ncbi:MAG: hypothetical protein UR26_C0003G0118 [candidate division TM6 bacterium GW2011_GWF2_32_72]|nr:MAG: hypothetical protein UR26_C0003G0118 [candidate division TM6 bacterium GW2011_GWF2_32_72]
MNKFLLITFFSLNFSQFIFGSEKQSGQPETSKVYPITIPTQSISSQLAVLLHGKDWAKNNNVKSPESSQESTPAGSFEENKLTNKPTNEATRFWDRD